MSWRHRLADWIAGVPHNHATDLAAFDRIYVDAFGHTHILDGSQGHSAGSDNSGFHHGPRTGCYPCMEGVKDTADLPKRFPA